MRLTVVFRTKCGSRGDNRFEVWRKGAVKTFVNHVVPVLSGKMNTLEFMLLHVLGNARRDCK